jgi:hypothetical protein
MELSETTNLEIVLYQHETYTYKDAAILTIVTPIFTYWLFDIDFPFLVFVSLLVFPFGFYLLHNMAVVFDLENHVVYRRLPLLGQFKIVDFSSIYSIEVLQPSGFNALFNGKHIAFCMIRRKLNPFGLGIPIISNLDTRSKAYETFYTETLPRLQDCVDSYQQQTAQNKTLLLLKHQGNGIYTYSNFGIAPILSSVFLFVVGIILFVKMLDTGVHRLFDVYSLVFIPLSFFVFFKNTLKLTFDTENGTFSVAYLFDIKKQTYLFEAFSNFTAIKNTHNFFFTNIEVSMLLINQKKIEIAKFTNDRKAEILMHEVLLVLGR